MLINRCNYFSKLIINPNYIRAENDEIDTRKRYPIVLDVADTIYITNYLLGYFAPSENALDLMEFQKIEDLNNLSNLNGEFRPGIVHRIDKDTSGIIVVAKNNHAHALLSEQFSKHTISRKYVALVWGVIRPLNGKISTLISRSKKNRQLMSVSDRLGKKAVTNYKTIKTFSSKEIPKISLVECILETGRTHQIRVHLEYKGNPLIGDKKYGKKKTKFKKINKKFNEMLSSFSRQALHAKSLGFIHPTKKKFVNFDSKLPNDFRKMLDFLDNFAN